MALNFPNPTRTFDEMRGAVGFVGHDGLFEIRFFVEAGALGTLPPPESDVFEAKCLSAFDEWRASIHKVALKVYAKRRSTSYTLTAADFR